MGRIPGRALALLIAIAAMTGPATADSTKRFEFHIDFGPTVYDDVEFTRFNWNDPSPCASQARSRSAACKAKPHWDFTFTATNLSGQTKAIAPLDTVASTDGEGAPGFSAANQCKTLILRPGETLNWKWDQDCVPGFIYKFSSSLTIDTRGPTVALPDDTIVEFTDPSTGYGGLRFRRSRKVVLGPMFYSISAPSEGLAAVRRTAFSRYGFIDITTGRIVIPEWYQKKPTFEHPHPLTFFKGRAWVCEDVIGDRCYDIDKQGVRQP